MQEPGCGNFDQFVRATIPTSDSGFAFCWSVACVYYMDPNYTDASIFHYMTKYNRFGNKVGASFLYGKNPSDYSNFTALELSDDLFAVIRWSAEAKIQRVRYVSGHFIKEDVPTPISSISVSKVFSVYPTLLPDEKMAIYWTGGISTRSHIFGKILPIYPRVISLIPFSLLKPPNNSYVTSGPPICRWNQPSEEEECFNNEIVFDFYLSLDSTFSDPIIERDVLDTFFVCNDIIPGEKYYWKVKARNLAGDELWCNEKSWCFIKKWKFVYGQKFRINSYQGDELENPALCQLKDGRFAVCWQSKGQDGSGFGIYGKILDINNSIMGSEFQVNSYAANDQTNPKISLLFDGGFVVCWESQNQDGSCSGIFGQIFDSTGTKKGNEFRINTYTYGNQFDHSIATLKNGNFVVCWASYATTPDKKGILGQLFDADGNKIGDEFQVNSNAHEKQKQTAIALLRNGNFVVCWTSGEENDSIYFQIFNELGEKIGNEVTVDDSNRLRAYIFPMMNGNFVIFWKRFVAPTFPRKIYAQVFNPQGSSATEKCDTGIWATTLPLSMISIDMEKFMLIRNDFDIEGYPHLYSQLFDSTLNKLQEREFRYSDSFTIYAPAVSPISNKGILFCWDPIDNLWGLAARQSITSVKSEESVMFPHFDLLQNYPNPFNSETRIIYELKKSGRVQLMIYDLLGREIAILVNEVQSPGKYTVLWRGAHKNGTELPSGIYLCHITTPYFSETKKLILIR